MQEAKRKIEKVFNNYTGKDEMATEILGTLKDQDDYILFRRELSQRNERQKPLYLCEKCGTPLELSCTPDQSGGHTFFFKHIKDPGFDKCPIKTGSEMNKEEILRRQYEFKSESKAHVFLKEKTGAIVRQFIDSNAIIDKQFINDRFGDKERRKPDVYFKYKGREITLEFQINNTFHSVIRQREQFYERNKISLMWIFAEFDPESFQSITIKDIYIPNGNNAFVFDDEAERASTKQKTFCLKVWYKKYEIRDESIEADWHNEIISIDQLKFHPETLRPYYFDCQADKAQREKELKEFHNKKKAKLFAEQKAAEVKNFLSRFKNNDYLPYEYMMEEIKGFTKTEREVLNGVLGLDKLLKNGNNIIQLLLKEKKHRNLISFLLKADAIELPLHSVNNEKETTLMTLIKVYPNSIELPQLLFARGYKLNQTDSQFIRDNYTDSKQEELLFLYSGYEKLAAYAAIRFFFKNQRKFMVLESAKNGELTMLGNGKQSLLWMANLAADKYSDYWYYFDRSFKNYGLYEKLFSEDKKGTFRKNFEKLASLKHERDEMFEEIVEVLYPEVLEKQDLISA